MKLSLIVGNLLKLSCINIIIIVLLLVKRCKGMVVMDKLMVSFTNYSIGTEALLDLAEICLQHGKRALVVGGKKALQRSRYKIEDVTKGTDLELVDFIFYGDECTYSNIDKVAKRASEENIDMIIGVGGGKSLDTAKGAAFKINIPVFTIPTISSTCAATSKLSVVYTDKGTFDSFYRFEKPPIHCFIDSDIIANAPEKYLWAGIGDTIAKYYECTLSSRGDKLDHSCGLGIEISGICVKSMLQYGQKGFEDCTQNINSFELEQVILNIIISTGLVSMLVEEKYNCAIAHSLFYGLASLENIEKNHLHGEVVAYGVLIQLIIDNQLDELKKLYNFYKKMKFPTSLSDIGVQNSKEYLAPIIEDTVNSPDMKYLPYKITKDMVFNAIQQLEKSNGYQ